MTVVRIRQGDDTFIIDLSDLKGVRWRCIRCGECCRSSYDRSSAIILGLLASLGLPPPPALLDAPISIICSVSEVLDIQKHSKMPASVFSVPILCLMEETSQDKVVVGSIVGIRRTPLGCFFLHGNSCSIYPHRPILCRLYPFTSMTLQKVRLRGEHVTWHLKVSYDPLCSGIGIGPKLSQKRLKEIAHLCSKFVFLLSGGERRFNITEADVRTLWPLTSTFTLPL